jgi:hypothetical protein
MTDHTRIVELSKQIAKWDQKAAGWRMRAANRRRAGGVNNVADAEIFEREASALDSDVRQLCVVMRRICQDDDARRYQWLRSRDDNTIVQGGVFIGLTPQNMILTLADADRHIDEEMEREPVAV